MIHCNKTMAARRRERKKNKIKESSTNVVQERCAKWVKVFTSLMGIDHIYKQESNIRLALWLWQASTCAVAKAAKRKKAQAIGLAFVMNPICYTNNHWNIFTHRSCFSSIDSSIKMVLDWRESIYVGAEHVLYNIVNRNPHIHRCINNNKNEKKWGEKRNNMFSLFGRNVTDWEIYIYYVCM